MDPLDPLRQLLVSILGESKHSFRKPGYEVQADEAGAPPAPSATPTASPSPAGVDRELLAQKIAETWGEDTPLLKDLDLYVQAGEKLPPNMDRLLPVALALRETQGGKDNINPAKNAKLGKNNVFNIRNETGAFQSYPDLQTAVMGNLEQGGQSGGLVGLLGGSKPSSSYIYEDFRRTGDYKDLFKKWSPPTDSNGSLDEQTQNINWILNQLR